MMFYDSYDSALVEERLEKRLRRLAKLRPVEKVRIWNAHMTNDANMSPDILHQTKYLCRERLRALNESRLSSWD